MKRVIVTGATGPIGIALVKYLDKEGILTTAVTRPGSPRNADLPVSDRIRLAACELADLSSLAGKLAERYDAFFHLGWNTSSRDVANDPFAQTRSILYTLDAVKLAHDLGCQVFVGAGSQAEYGRVEQPLTVATPARPETSYGVAKYAAGELSRRLCETLGLRHCWARILSVFGPFDRETTAIMYCINALLNGQKPVLTRAEQRWDYIYSADCAKAIYLIAEKGRHGTAYPVGSGQARPLKEYFERIRGLIDPSLPLGFGERPYADRQIMYLGSDNTVLTKDTGFAPEYSFDMGIRETIDWAKNNRRSLKERKR